MATTYKVLAQTGSSGSTGNGSATLTATTNTNLYTVPASTATIVSTITVANQAATAGTYRIAIRPSGAAIAVSMCPVFRLRNYAGVSSGVLVGVVCSA